MKAISFQNVTKSFGPKKILNNVSFDLEENMIYGFVGPNGAGKTTTIKMILGLLKFDTGFITIFGKKVNFGRTDTNQLIGYLPDVPEYYDYMTALEYLDLCSGLARSKHKLSNKELLRSVGLDDNHQKIATYSRGMKQRLGLAQALVHDPKIIICDEPTSALDPKGRQDILDIISNLRGEKTVIFSTHILSDVEKMCDHVLVLTKCGIYSLEELKGKKSEENYSVRILIKVTKSEAKVLSHNYQIEKKDNEYALTLKGSKMDNKADLLAGFYQDLVSLKISPSAIEVIDNSLEELYLEVTK